MAIRSIREIIKTGSTIYDYDKLYCECDGNSDGVIPNPGIGLSSLRVNGNQLDFYVDDILETSGIKLYGVNIGDPFHIYLNSNNTYDFVNNALLSYLKNTLYCNSVRLAIHSGLYKNHKADCINYLKQNVQLILNARLIPIVDWHVVGDPDGEASNLSYDSTLEGNQTEMTLAEEFWDTISKEITNPRVIYELWNEPMAGVTWNTLKPKWETLISIIRNNGRGN